MWVRNLNFSKRRHDYVIMEEWNEARNSIARFDRILSEVRRFGFVILSASVGFGAKEMFTDGKTNAAYYLIPLLCAVTGFFVVDCYYELLLNSAIHRCKEIEKANNLPKLTGKIDKQVRSTHSRSIITGLYILYILSISYVAYVMYGSSAEHHLSHILYIILVLLGPPAACLYISHLYRLFPIRFGYGCLSYVIWYCLYVAQRSKRILQICYRMSIIVIFAFSAISIIDCVYMNNTVFVVEAANKMKYSPVSVASSICLLIIIFLQWMYKHQLKLMNIYEYVIANDGRVMAERVIEKESIMQAYANMAYKFMRTCKKDYEKYIGCSDYKIAIIVIGKGGERVWDRVSRMIEIEVKMRAEVFKVTLKTDVDYKTWYKLDRSIKEIATYKTVAIVDDLRGAGWQLYEFVSGELINKHGIKNENINYYVLINAKRRNFSKSDTLGYNRNINRRNIELIKSDDKMGQNDKKNAVRMEKKIFRKYKNSFCSYITNERRRLFGCGMDCYNLYRELEEVYAADITGEEDLNRSDQLKNESFTMISVRK